jgi:uncharacterized protein involved in oxidation of intracellular sulfur
MAQTVLIVLNEAPYGSERSYNGLRLALQLGRQDGISVRVYLMADSIGCAIRGQKTPDGYYNIERMLKGVLNRAEVRACGLCMEARGLAEDAFVAGVKKSTMPELGEWVASSDKVIVF